MYQLVNALSLLGSGNQIELKIINETVFFTHTLWQLAITSL